MQPLLGVIMGSTSDWETMKHACGILDELGIPSRKKVVSAHRTPDLMFEYAETARERRLESHHCRSGRSRPPAGNGRSQNDAARHRCAGSVKSAERPRFAAFNRSNAGRSTRLRPLPSAKRERSTQDCLRRRFCQLLTKSLPKDWTNEGKASDKPCWKAVISLYKQTIFPGATIGIIGGGQLGKMMAVAAKQMGYKIAVVDPVPSSPCGQVADLEITASL